MSIEQAPKEGWQFLTTRHRSAETLVHLLDELGEADWEPVTIVWHPEGHFVAFLKRYQVIE